MAGHDEAVVTAATIHAAGQPAWTTGSSQVVTRGLAEGVMRRLEYTNSGLRNANPPYELIPRRDSSQAALGHYVWRGTRGFAPFHDISGYSLKVTIAV